MIDKVSFANWLKQLRADPRSRGVPHDELRENQLHALGMMRPVLNGLVPFSFLEKPTGTGKSVIPTALARLTDVTVLTHRRALSNQYAQIYGFDVLHGKDEYACVHVEKQVAWARVGAEAPTAADCHYDKMSDCPYHRECPFIIARERAVASRKAVFTSRLALMNKRLRARPGVWVLDECHALVEESLGFQQETLHADQLRKHRLTLPDIAHGRVGLLEDAERAFIIAWAMRSATEIIVPKSASIGNAQARKLIGRLERLSIELASGAWFIKREQDTLTLQGLDARSILSRLWRDDRPVILMSATLGNVEHLARSAGIKTEDYSFVSYPHPIPPDARPIFDLRQPSMSWKNIQDNPRLLDDQAHDAAEFIQLYPPDYPVLLMTTSNARVDILRWHMREQFGERFYVAPGHNLAERTQAYIYNLSRGIISAETLSGWGTGLDLPDVEIVGVCGVQFFNRSDPFSQARLLQMELDQTLGYEEWLANLGTVQALGRNVRGKKDSAGRYIRRIGMVADGLATSKRALASYPATIKEAIRRP